MEEIAPNSNYWVLTVDMDLRSPDVPPLYTIAEVAPSDGGSGGFDGNLGLLQLDDFPRQPVMNPLCKAFTNVSEMILKSFRHFIWSATIRSCFVMIHYCNLCGLLQVCLSCARLCWSIALRGRGHGNRWLEPLIDHACLMPTAINTWLSVCSSQFIRCTSR